MINNDDANKKIKETSDKAEGTGVSFQKGVKKAAVWGAAIVGAATAAAGGIAAIVLSNEELNRDLARLRTNAVDAGFGLKTVEDNFKKIAAVSGETDSAVETLSNLMQTNFSDNQLSQVIDNINGAAIRFSDTLKSEGIADGLQETFATGKAIGQFGELLERSGVDIEKFNEGLEKAKKEGSETDYVLQQLASTGLTSAYDEYVKLNPEVAKASEAGVNLQVAMANLALKLTPFVTKAKEITTAFVEWVTNSAFVQNAFNTLKGFMDKFDGGSVVSTFIKIKDGAIAAFEFLLPYIQPVLTAVSDFIKNIWNQILSYWESDGKQLVAAAKNAFDMIMSIINFVMPAIQFLIQTVWGNIKGIIGGALDVIIGVLRIFTGLFTGDWSKMWEGIKQALSGALEFLWNLFSLLMIGKLLGGIKAFISSGLGFFKNFGTALSGTFRDFLNNIINLFNYFRATGSSVWSAIVSSIKNLVSGFVNAVKANFTGLFNNATSTFGKIKDAITNPIRTAKNLVKGFIDEIKGFFKGLKLQLPKIKMPKFSIKNWSKNPVDWIKAMPTLSVDWYAKGTKYAPGGLAVVGEQGPELMHVPRGSKIDTASKTKDLLNKPSEQVINIQPSAVYLSDQVIGEIVFKVVDVLMTDKQQTEMYLQGVR